MTLIHKIIIMRKKAIMLGRRKQRKDDMLVVDQLKIDHDFAFKSLIDSHKSDVERLQENHGTLMKNMIDTNEKEITKLKEQHQAEIKKMQRQHDTDVATIRNQVQKHYDPILEERNNEISRLNAEKLEQKKYYKSILDYGIAMENSGERAAGFFTRAQSKVKEAAECAVMSQSKFAEAMQLVDRGNSCVEAIQQTVGKTTPRLLKNIKE
jgi:ElaB/YqjD/DUF883 family membrane-anchored ribosome-binding protein